jgi:hypothetical protein
MNSKSKSEADLVSELTGESPKRLEVICRDATKDFLFSLWNQHSAGIDWDTGKDDKDCLAIISRCANLLARLRGAINVYMPDNASGESGYKHHQPIVEKPSRINRLFYNLARGHAVVAGRSQVTREDLAVILRLAFDSAPFERANLFKLLLEKKGELSADDIESLMNVSNPTALAEMEKLKILGICTIVDLGRGEKGRPHRRLCLEDDLAWFLSDECRNLLGGI